MKRRLSLLLAILMLISVMCVAPVTASAADTYTVYCINSAKWDTVCAYAWGSSAMTWPGEAMTKTGETVNGYDVYSYSTSTSYANVIFNNNNNGSQTKDLTWTEGQYFDVKAGKWYASLEDVPVVDTKATDVYLVGEFNGWSTVADEFKLVKEGSSIATFTKTLEADTTYKFKIVRNGAWTSNKTPITASASGLVFSSSVSDNATLTTTYAGDYVFTWDTSKSQLSVEYPAAPVETTTEAIVETDPVETTTEAPVETDPVETTTEAPVETDPVETTTEVPAETDPVETTQAPTETPDFPTTGDEIPTEPAEPTEPEETVPASGYITVYFENNWKWTDVFYYSWGSAYAENTTWGNGPVEYVATNEFGNDIYKAIVAADANILFAGTKDDGSGNLDQTPDITSKDLYDGVCFYMMWDNGNVVGSYEYVVPQPMAVIEGYSITLTGNIGVNFFLTLSDEVLADADAKVVFTYADKTYEVLVADGIYDEATGFYKFTCEVPVKDMATVVSCKVVSGDKESDTFTQSVKDYAEVILADTETFAKEQKIVKAMLNYGAAAQVYFGYNTDNLANDTEFMTDEDRFIHPTTFIESGITIHKVGDGITYYGSTLSLKSETAVKHYFIIDEDVVDVDSLYIICPEGYDIEVRKNGNLYEITIFDIPAHKLGDNVHIYIDEYLYVTYMPSISYGYAVQNNGNTELLNVATTLYDYHTQAVMYYNGWV